MSLWPRQRPLHILRAMCGAIALGAASMAPAATITVNSAMFGALADGSCDLSEAIRNANASATDVTMGDCAIGDMTGVQDFIEFNIVAALPIVISPTMALPIIDDTMVIDGLTQSPTAMCGGTLAIILDGGAAPAGSGFTIDSFVTNVTIRGFSIINFPVAGVTIDGDDNFVDCNYIGVGADGTGAMGNLFGITVTGSGNIIGGPTTADRNVISGNVSDGIFINGGAVANFVVLNYIGLEIDGFQHAANRLGADSSLEIFLTELFLGVHKLLFRQQLLHRERSQARFGNHIAFEIKDALKLLESHIEQQADARRQ